MTFRRIGVFLTENVQRHCAETLALVETSRNNPLLAKMLVGRLGIRCNYRSISRLIISPLGAP